jgi:predicted transcriptional regulator
MVLTVFQGLTGDKPLLDIVSKILSSSVDGVDEAMIYLDADASRVLPTLLKLGLLEIRRVGDRVVYVTSVKGRVLLEEYKLFKKNSSDI